ncbi:MAG: DUF308 domain-containing protein [Phycisphaerales bacterium]|nr:DUF308 domain-containing protein [Phycisphaerales bacterium]
MPHDQPTTVLRSAANFAIIEGILLLIGGIFLLFTDKSHTITFLGEFTGALLVIAGLVGVVRAIIDARGGASWIGPVIALLSGLILLLDGQVAGPAIVQVLGAFLATFGVIQFAAAFASHAKDQRGLLIISGSITLLLGLTVFLWPKLAMVLFTVIVGIWLVLLGFMMLRGGLVLRKATP